MVSRDICALASARVFSGAAPCPLDRAGFRCLFFSSFSSISASPLFPSVCLCVYFPLSLPLSVSHPSLTLSLFLCICLSRSILAFLLSGVLRAAPERVGDRDREPKPPPEALGRPVGRMQESHQGPRPHHPVHGLRRVSLLPRYTFPLEHEKQNAYS